MANEIEKIGEDILKVVEDPFKFVAKATKVIATVVKDDPQAKTIITQVVTLSSAIGVDGATILAAKGIVNPEQYLATLQAVEALGAYIKSTVVPFVEQVYGEVVTDVEAPAPAAPAATPAAA